MRQAVSLLPQESGYGNKGDIGAECASLELKVITGGKALAEESEVVKV